MATGKKSFLLYCDIINTVAKLPDEQAGKLFKIILEYVNDNNPTVDDLLLQIAFEPIKQQLKRDLVKWESKSTIRSESGRLGGIKSGEARRNKTKQNEANASNEKQNEPVTDNVTVNVNDTDMKESYTFEQFWNDYNKKTDKFKAEKKWKTLTEKEKELIKIHVPKYVAVTFDKNFRKNPTTYLNGKCWNDEIIIKQPNSPQQTGGRLLTPGILPTEPGSYLPK